MGGDFLRCTVQDNIIILKDSVYKVGGGLDACQKTFAGKSPGFFQGWPGMAVMPVDAVYRIFGNFIEIKTRSFSRRN